MNPVLKTGRYNRWQANSKSDIFLLQPLSSKHNGAQFWPLSQTASSKALRKPFISFQPSPNLKCSVFFSSHIDLYLSEINGSWDNNEIQGKKWLLYKWPDTKWEIGYIPSELCILFLLYSRIKKRDYLFLWRLRKGCYEQQNFPLGRERERKNNTPLLRCKAWKSNSGPLSTFSVFLSEWLLESRCSLQGGEPVLSASIIPFCWRHIWYRELLALSPHSRLKELLIQSTLVSRWVTEDMQCTLQLQQQSTCSTDNLLQFTMFPFSWKTCSTTSG